MTLAHKEKILCFALVIQIILHMDVWAWDRIKPFLFVIFPHHFWWGFIVFTSVIGVFLWWSFYKWKDVTPQVVQWGMNYKNDMEVE